MKFDHVGVVVSNIDQYFHNFLRPVCKVNCLGETFIDYNQQSKVAFAVTDNQVRIELIEPLNGLGPVAEIVKQKRGGLHHICFLADEFEKDMKNFQENGCLMISPPKSAVAFDNRRVVFFFTPSLEVIELVEEVKNT